MKTLTLIFMGFLSLAASAQQDAGFSMYFFNPVYINPAYAGSREVFSGSLVHRSQWVGMPGAPSSQSLSIHSAIPNSKVGLGLQVYNDAAGPMKNTGINLTFAYHLKVSEKAKLSFGVSGMVNNIRLGYSDINIDDNTDQAFINNSASGWVPDANAGLYFYKPRFYFGLSANHLLQSKFALTEIVGSNMARFSRQFYLTSGVVLPVTKKIDFRPSILIKYVKAAPALLDLNLSLIFFKKLFVGVGYRTGKRVDMPGMDNMLIGMIEYDIKSCLRLGYSYDYYLNRSGTYNGGTHEFMLGWDINGTKTKMSSPRFF